MKGGDALQAVWDMMASGIGWRHPIRVTSPVTGYTDDGKAIRFRPGIYEYEDGRWSYRGRIKDDR
jgi:hypothetical protein